MIYKFGGKRLDNLNWVYGHYFKTPLTDEATNSKPEDGWFFLTGKERHVISTENGSVYEVNLKSVVPFLNLIDKYDREVYAKDELGGLLKGSYIDYCDKCKQYQIHDIYDHYCHACNGDLNWQEFVDWIKREKTWIIGSMLDRYDTKDWI